MQVLQQQVDPGPALRPEELHKGIAETSRRPRSRLVAAIVAEVVSYSSSQLPHPTLDQRDHRGGCALLRSKNMSRTVRTTERISDITRQDKVTVTQHFTECLSLDPEGVSQRPQHTHPTIAGGGAAQPYDEASTSSPIGICDHFTHTI